MEAVESDISLQDTCIERVKSIFKVVNRLSER